MLIGNMKRMTDFYLRHSHFLYLAVWSVYSLYFHPLSRYPGPKLAAISPMVHSLWDIRGKQHPVVRKLYDPYSSVIRIAPNTLIYNSAAWKDIYGHHKKGRKLFVKDSAPCTRRHPMG